MRAGWRMRGLFAAALLGLSQAGWAGLFSSQAEDEEALTQQRAALLLEINGMARVNQVISRLETAAVSLCEGDLGVNPGFAVAARDRFPSEMREAARSLGYDRQARVMYVAEGSPAARAGLLAGDVVVAVNGENMGEGADVHEAVEARLRKVAAGQGVTLSLQRTDGVMEDLVFVMPAACNYTPHLLRSHVINAASTGWDIHVTTAMLDFLDSDAELAAVLAHEMAHSMMSHVARKFGNLLLGKLADALLSAAAGPAGSLLVNLAAPGERLGAMAYSQSFEREADYIAMYILALADYPMPDTPRLWRRLAVEFPEMHERSYFASHPATPERILIQQLTIEEIDAKLAAQAPLRPELEGRVAAFRGGE